MLPLKHVASLAVIATGLAALEWWSVNALTGGAEFSGPLMGIACVAVLATLPVVANRVAASWHGAVVAALNAVVELVLSVAVLGSLSAIAVMLLPFSISARFMQGDAATDCILFVMLALGLLVAARGWAKYVTQSLLATHAQLEAQRTRAQLAERDHALAKSELNVLRAQIEPHFLWNTLAHVQYLIRKSPEDAEKMTRHLIRFLRSAVPQIRGNATTLSSEIESVQAYLELMKIRMGPRLTVAVELDNRLCDTPFPALLIQTLVENAIKHGLEPKVGPVTLSVVAHAVAQTQSLFIEVTDNGVGLQNSSATAGTGLGLKSVRERLQLHYGSDAGLQITGSVDGGVRARIQIPFPMST